MRDIDIFSALTFSGVELQPGDYVAVHVTEALSPNTLRAAPLARCTLATFAEAEAAGQLRELLA